MINSIVQSEVTRDGSFDHANAACLQVASLALDLVSTLHCMSMNVDSNERMLGRLFNATRKDDTAACVRGEDEVIANTSGCHVATAKRVHCDQLTTE